MGAGGIQAALSSLEPAYLRKLRDRAVDTGMYIEVMSDMPRRDDTSAFERTVAAAKEAERCACACLPGRQALRDLRHLAGMAGARRRKPDRDRPRSRDRGTRKAAARD